MTESQTWYVYLMKCPRGLYCGITTNPRSRLHAHRTGKGAKSVKALGHPEELRTVDVYDSRSAAQIREADIKKFSPSVKQNMFANCSIESFK